MLFHPRPKKFNARCLSPVVRGVYRAKPEDGVQSLQFEWLPRTIQVVDSDDVTIHNEGDQVWRVKQIAFANKSSATGADRQLAVQLIVPGHPTILNPISVSPAEQPPDSDRSYLFGINLSDEEIFTEHTLSLGAMGQIKRAWPFGDIYKFWALRFFDLNGEVDSDTFTITLDIDVGINLSNRANDANSMPTKAFLPHYTVT